MAKATSKPKQNDDADQTWMNEVVRARNPSSASRRKKDRTSTDDDGVVAAVAKKPVGAAKKKQGDAGKQEAPGKLRKIDQTKNNRLLSFPGDVHKKKAPPSSTTSNVRNPTTPTTQKLTESEQYQFRINSASKDILSQRALVGDVSKSSRMLRQLQDFNQSSVTSGSRGNKSKRKISDVDEESTVDNSIKTNKLKRTKISSLEEDELNFGNDDSDNDKNLDSQPEIKSKSSTLAGVDKNIFKEFDKVDLEIFGEGSTPGVPFQSTENTLGSGPFSSMTDAEMTSNVIAGNNSATINPRVLQYNNADQATSGKYSTYVPTEKNINYYRKLLKEHNLPIKFVKSSSMKNGKKICDLATFIFGTDSPKGHILFGLLSFLNNSYYSTDDRLLFSIFDFEIKNKVILSSAEGLKIIYLLLNPRQSIDDVVVDTSDTASTVLGDIEKQKPQFVISSFTVRGFDEPKKDTVDLPLEITDFVDGLFKDNWISMDNDFNLPILALCQPLGFQLRICDETKEIQVYIYLTLTTDGNSRKIFAKERLWDTGSILANLQLDCIGERHELHNNPIKVHPFIIKKASGTNDEDELFLENAVASQVAPSATKFGNYSYRAEILKYSKMRQIFANIFGKFPKDIFDNYLDVSLQSSERMAGFLLYYNMFHLIMKTCNNLRSHNDYEKLFKFLLPNVENYFNDTDEGQSKWQFPKHFINKNNIIFVTRLMFRSLSKELGLFFLEGNARNYAHLLATSGRRNFDCFFGKATNNERDLLGKPDLTYIASKVQVSFILHKKQEIFVPKYPYAGLLKEYQTLGKIYQESTELSAPKMPNELALNIFPKLQTNKFPCYEVYLKWNLGLKKLIMKLWKTMNKPAKEAKSPDEQIKEKDEGSYFKTIFGFWCNEKKQELFTLLVEEEFYKKYFKKTMGINKNKKTSEIDTLCANNMDVLLRKSTLDNNLIRVIFLYICGLVCPIKLKNGVNSIDHIHAFVEKNGITNIQNDDEEDISGSFHLDLMTYVDNYDNTDEIGQYYNNYAGVLPSGPKMNSEEHFKLFAKAFYALYYSPVIVIAALLTNCVQKQNQTNIRVQDFKTRAMFASYYEVIDLYKTMGTIIPIPVSWKNDLKLALLQTYMLQDHHLIRKQKEENDVKKPGKSKHNPMHHFYHPSEITPQANYHLSSNIPNFVHLISYAIVFYYHWEQSGGKLANIDDEKYIIRINTKHYKSLFGQSPHTLPNPDLKISDVDFEHKFAIKYYQKNYIKDPENFCYIKSMLLKLHFVKAKYVKEAIVNGVELIPLGGEKKEKPIQRKGLSIATIQRKASAHVGKQPSQEVKKAKSNTAKLTLPKPSSAVKSIKKPRAGKTKPKQSIPIGEDSKPPAKVPNPTPPTPMVLPIVAGREYTLTQLAVAVFTKTPNNDVEFFNLEDNFWTIVTQLTNNDINQSWYGELYKTPQKRMLTLFEDKEDNGGLMLQLINNGEDTVNKNVVEAKIDLHCFNKNEKSNYIKIESTELEKLCDGFVKNKVLDEVEDVDEMVLQKTCHAKMAINNIERAIRHMMIAKMVTLTNHALHGQTLMDVNHVDKPMLSNVASQIHSWITKTIIDDKMVTEGMMKVLTEIKTGERVSKKTITVANKRALKNHSSDIYDSNDVLETLTESTSIINSTFREDDCLMVGHWMFPTTDSTSYHEKDEIFLQYQNAKEKNKLKAAAEALNVAADSEPNKNDVEDNDGNDDDENKVDEEGNNKDSGDVQNTTREESDDNDSDEEKNDDDEDDNVSEEVHETVEGNETGGNALENIDYNNLETDRVIPFEDDSAGGYTNATSEHEFN